MTIYFSLSLKPFSQCLLFGQEKWVAKCQPKSLIWWWVMRWMDQENTVMSLYKEIHFVAMLFLLRHTHTYTCTSYEKYGCIGQVISIKQFDRNYFKQNDYQTERLWISILPYRVVRETFIQTHPLISYYLSSVNWIFFPSSSGLSGFLHFMVAFHLCRIKSRAVKYFLTVFPTTYYSDTDTTNCNDSPLCATLCLGEIIVCFFI